jgi:hypothetical protein
MANNRLSGTLPDIAVASRITLRYTNLQLISLADNQFEGTIPLNFASIEAWRQVVLRNNRLSGEIPDEFGTVLHAQHSDYGRLTYMRVLAVLDVSQNPEIVGAIPENLFSLPSLQVVGIEGNLQMKCPADSALYNDFQPTKIKYQWGNDLMCTQFSGTHVLLISPTYVDYLGCICKSNFGTPPFNCAPCPQHCECTESKTSWAIGFYPQCFTTAASGNQSTDAVGPCEYGTPVSDFSHVIACQSRQCNPEGTCQFDPVTGLNCTSWCGSAGCRSLCAQGYADRLCSNCAQGFYSVSHHCHSCPEEDSSIWIWWLLSAVVLILVMVLTAPSKSVVVSSVCTLSVCIR